MTLNGIYMYLVKGNNHFDFKVHAGIFTIFSNIITMTYVAALVGFVVVCVCVSLCNPINVKNARQNKLSTWRTCLNFYLII